MMGIDRRAAACGVAIALALTPAITHAQFGGTLGIREPVFSSDEIADSERRGFEVRAFRDWDRTPTLGWRAEITYAQMKYKRTEGLERFTVTENTFELGALARLTKRDGALTGVYLLAGPLVAHRPICGGTSSSTVAGQVSCGEPPNTRVGGQIGLGGSVPQSRNDLMWEARYVTNSTAGAGGGLLTISLGLKRRARLPD